MSDRYLDFRSKKDLGLLDVLNQRKVNKYEMDKVFNEWMNIGEE